MSKQKRSLAEDYAIKSTTNSAFKGIPKSFKEYQSILGYKTVKAIKTLFKNLRKQRKIPKVPNERLFGTKPIRRGE